MVGMPGFEPGASTSRTWRAAKLRYIPFRGGSVPQADGQPVGVGEPPAQASAGVLSGSGTTNR